MEQWLVPLLAALVFVLALVVVRARIELEQRVQTRFESWREHELESRAMELYDKWKLEDEPDIRRDAVKRSRSVLTGKVTEHLVPISGAFPYDPSDARFLGSPIDLIVFDGLNAEALEEIVFVEVKTGSKASLSTRERRVRDCVRAGRVRWHELRID